MTFMPRMTAETRAIRTLRPLSWRRWPGVIADVWHVHGEAGGGGFYRAPDPRLVVFLGGGRGLRLRTDDGSPWQEDVSVMYVPAGVPLWSAFSESGDHAHLDLHLDSGPLRQRLCNQPRGALSRPRLANGGPQVHMLARMIAAEVEHPARPDMASDGLLSALLSEVLDLGPPETGGERGGLPPHLLQKLESHARAALHRRITSAELAEVAGLSESWLTRGFRASRGQTPQKWLMALRLEAAEAMMPDPRASLAEIAAACGFSDQAHLTRAFRARHGETPGEWRRKRFVPDASKRARPVQAAGEYPIYLIGKYQQRSGQ
ncbi:MAG: AraC family transcriptional regulator [Rhodobacteraceae bacterium]|jgi:AraC family transcriptional regulator|uniref:DNA-binding domain-containing protein, AraC-type n=1 Tax=Salipiger profundus TaxID=1229727 RepID=A0A1U7DCX9_9RHOB|nr:MULTISPECIES: AraC family transcriptional regulator [Salipiger]APX25920.1 DNA-binding domain-containing protein, AraC-type [Salipiger profundus]MAB05057.1 AraC family transcriptional regulator [Paracoccaceae bacterium]SFC82787.1 transcriptional regulator, AraC family [Salipiger profundus]